MFIEFEISRAPNFDVLSSGRCIIRVIFFRLGGVISFSCAFFIINCSKDKLLEYFNDHYRSKLQLFIKKCFFFSERRTSNWICCRKRLFLCFLPNSHLQSALWWNHVFPYVCLCFFARLFGSLDLKVSKNRVVKFSERNPSFISAFYSGQLWMRIWVFESNRLANLVGILY